MSIRHLRAGRSTTCGIVLWGDEFRGNYVPWANDYDDANCPDCVINAIPYMLSIPEGVWEL